MHERRISECLTLFDLPGSFSEAQLKQAYRDLAQVWHPDKYSHNERLRTKADEKMKEINEAYSVLQSCLVDGQFHQHRVAPAEQESDFTRSPSRPDPATSSQPNDQATTSNPQPQPFSSIVWAMVGLLVILILIGIKTPRHSANAAKGSQDGSLPEATSDAFSSFDHLRVAPPSALIRLPGCKVLDEKNGFKALRFGMTINEARKTAMPQLSLTNEYRDQVMFLYQRGDLNQLGSFPLDLVQAYFFRGTLFQIQASFLDNQDPIFEAMQQNYGPACQSDGWTRGSEPVRASCWSGEKVLCAIVGPAAVDNRRSWVELAMYDIVMNKAAQEYADEEPIRALKMVTEEGIGEFKFGMSLNSFRQQLSIAIIPEDTGLECKAVMIPPAHAITLGRYPLQQMRAEFFKNRLFRVELSFDQNQEKIFKGFMAQFPDAVQNDTWTRGTEKLTARQHSGKKAIAVILADKSMTPQWDLIYLYDLTLDTERQQFERDAPKRAVKDF